MADSDIYRQCELSRPCDAGTAVEVAWIPTKWARVGKTLQIKVDGEWREGYVVTAVYETMPFSALQIQRHAEKRWKDVLGKDDDAAGSVR